LGKRIEGLKKLGAAHLVKRFCTKLSTAVVDIERCECELLFWSLSRLPPFRPEFGLDAVMLSRRRLLLALATGSLVGLDALPAGAQQKVSQSAALYQDQPRAGFSCAACSLFRPPDACAVVVGPISPRGWCRFFDLPD
jgi:hypothetical protein